VFRYSAFYWYGYTFWCWQLQNSYAVGENYKLSGLSYSGDGTKILVHDEDTFSYPHSSHPGNRNQIVIFNSQLKVQQRIDMPRNGSGDWGAGDCPQMSSDGNEIYFKWYVNHTVAVQGYKLGRVDLTTQPVTIDLDYGDFVFGDTGESWQGFIRDFKIDYEGNMLYVVRLRSVSWWPPNPEPSLGSELIKISIFTPHIYDSILVTNSSNQDRMHDFAWSYTCTSAEYPQPAFAFHKFHSGAYWEQVGNTWVSQYNDAEERNDLVLYGNMPFQRLSNIYWNVR
jgi:hypothetical protein